MVHLESEDLCPSVEAAFDLMAKKWAGLSVNALLPGQFCFSALERAIPALGARVLSVRVRELEEAGVLDRRVSPDTPLRVIYSLTEKGRALESIIRAIADLARARGDSGP